MLPKAFLGLNDTLKVEVKLALLSKHCIAGGLQQLEQQAVYGAAPQRQLLETDKLVCRVDDEGKLLQRDEEGSDCDGTVSTHGMPDTCMHVELHDA